MAGIQDQLRRLPAVDRVLREELLLELSARMPRATVADAVQEEIEVLRRQLLHGEVLEDELLLPEHIAAAVSQRCTMLLQPSLRKVINASGTLLHTNLGRAPLATQALAAIDAVARGYSNLEYDLTTGERGQRYSHVETLLRELTGAEAALVVNNNAAAVLLALTALGQGREAIVSRGELVEIGGAFRIPDVMAAGGVILREVGTTNRTHLRDYDNAVTDATAVLLKVHTSNYRIVGFSHSVVARELVPLARERGLVLLEDLGSGLLLDLSRYGLEAEPTVPEIVQSGVDVVTFSGDKLLGGPQAGLIVGRRTYIERLRKHPLARAMRIDKLTLAALEATLRLYLQPQEAFSQVPVLRMFAAPEAEQQRRCQALCECLQQEALPADIWVAEDISKVGGGAMPLTELADRAVVIRPHHGSVSDLAASLRAATPAVVGRVQQDQLWLNLRAVFPDEEELLARSVATALGEGQSGDE